MKITESRLKKLIGEEIELMIENGEIDEGVFRRLKARAGTLGTQAKGYAMGALQKGAAKAARGAAALGSGTAATVAGELGAAAEKTAAGTQAQVKAQRTLSILDGYIKDLVNDLTKLGIDLNTPGLKGALASLQKAVKGSIAKAAATPAAAPAAAAPAAAPAAPAAAPLRVAAQE